MCTQPNANANQVAPQQQQSQPANNAPVAIQNPLGVSSVCGLIKALLSGALQIGIPIAVLFIVYTGFKFVLARGNSEKLVEAQQSMLLTVIGIGIFLGTWLLAQVIANTINSLQNGGSNASIASCQ